MSAQKVNLFNLDRDHLRHFMGSLAEKAFHADQVYKWIHQVGCLDFALMTNLSKPLRQKLNECALITPLEQVIEQHAADGTRKWLLRLKDGNCIETVFIPEPGRGTLCVSSQIGCALNCTFCATGSMGFNRNLTLAEIIGQVWHAVHRLKAEKNTEKVTNVVMMGMGEPLLNYDAVVAAMDLMMDDLAYGLSKYRVTLSTSGVVPAMAQLKQDSRCALAVSLHAPTDRLRNILVPINKKYPLAQLMAICRDYFSAVDRKRRHITFEYVMLHEVNDSAEDARALIKLLAGVPAKINLIPFNPFPHARYTCSKASTIEKFKQLLTRAGYITLIRKTRGDDISAACGQLVGDFKDRTKRSARIASQYAVQGVNHAAAVPGDQGN